MKQFTLMVLFFLFYFHYSNFKDPQLHTIGNNKDFPPSHKTDFHDQNTFGFSNINTFEQLPFCTNVILVNLWVRPVCVMNIKVIMLVLHVISHFKNNINKTMYYIVDTVIDSELICSRL